MPRWRAIRQIHFIDATVEEGQVLESADLDKQPWDIRKAYRRRKERLAATEPAQQIVAIHFEGKARWVTAPADVTLAQAPLRPGLLPRRRPKETK